MASRYSVFLTTSVEAQLRNAPPQLQGYVAGIIAALRVDPTAASVFLDIIEGERYRTIVFPGGRGFLDYQVFEDPAADRPRGSDLALRRLPSLQE